MWISKREYQALQQQIKDYRTIIQDLRKTHHIEVQSLKNQIDNLQSLVTELARIIYRRPLPPVKELPERGGRWVGDGEVGVYVSQEEMDVLLGIRGIDDHDQESITS